mmetsp:Transcript_9056/g.12159  ORF Transcript_9056/g.12159 Transcript_9056/m.12159 type:complete len:254 (+) Transcript_9056:112-873(+)
MLCTPLATKLFFFSGSNKLSQSIINEDWHEVKRRCKKYPREAKVWTKRVGFFDGEHESRILPIHQACALHAPKDVIDALIKAYPKGVQALETSFMRNTLHVALMYGCSSDVIELLLFCDPLCAQTEDTLGRLPIHYACSNGSNPDVLKLLLSADPSSARASDKNGWLPIHVAIHMGASTESIKELLDANPSSVNAKTDKRNTPMTLLSRVNCKNKDEVKRLLDSIVIEKSSVEQKQTNFHNSLRAKVVTSRSA